MGETITGQIVIKGPIEWMAVLERAERGPVGRYTIVCPRFDFDMQRWAAQVEAAGLAIAIVDRRISQRRGHGRPRMLELGNKRRGDRRGGPDWSGFGRVVRG